MYCTMFYIIGLFGQSWFGFIVPIRESMPLIWRALKTLSTVIVTTRNGLFFGFLFVAIGMLFAYYDVSISKTKTAILFVISMMLMFIETFVLKSISFIRGSDMYLFLIPSAFFMFCLIKQIDLPDNKCYFTMRIMSSLIFYTHVWIRWIVTKLFNSFGINIQNTPFRFFIVLCITLIVSYAIYALSNKDKFKWMKSLFS